ncbi:MAG: hypothetical protein K2N35_10280 [Muribaculaceae bacterium]|nr:hypothetical protein [Muribaculaceae bacterium]
MKKFLLSAAIALLALPAFADLQGDGYYRVQNAITKRYAYLLDNKGSFDSGTTSADVQALELYLDFLKAESDPSTIFYINKVDVSGSKISYNIGGQGTSIYGFLGEYVKIMKMKSVDGMQGYHIYASKSTLTKYLGDKRSNPDAEKGLSSIDVTDERRLWYIHSVDAESSDSYFGVLPTLTANGKYYYPMYAGFPYDAKSEGMKFYTITKINSMHKEPAVALKEIKGVIPAGTPVIIECSHPLPTDNRLNVGATGNAADLTGNMLKGVYFNNDNGFHTNHLEYNKKTMRILTVKNGNLVFDVADIDYLPRNQAYLQLTDASQYGVGCYKVVSEDEYDSNYDAVESIAVDMLVDVYSIDGHLIKQAVKKEDVPSLGKGLYILRHGSASERMIVH